MTNFDSLILFTSFFWLMVFIKKLLFWVYLWQLKEYHLARFIDHFRTHKGKRLILNPINLIELGLIVYLFIPSAFQFLDFFTWQSLVILFFVSYGTKTFLDVGIKNLKIPVFTKKTIFILFAGFVLIIGISFLLFATDYYLVSTVTFVPLLVLDILSPLIFSVLVLALEPIAIFWRKQLIEKAKKKRALFKNLITIGITGSYGKTSTKEFLYEVLSGKFKVLKTEKHQNSEVGISQCILNNLNIEHQIFVCEMGAYNKGGIKMLCDIVNPKIGILTGINEQHMATFGSQKNIIKAKYELIDSLPDNGLAIFNGDNKYCLNLYKKTKKLKKVSSTSLMSIKYADIWVSDIKTGKEHLSFKVFTKDGDTADFNLNLYGVKNIENILLSILAAQELGMDLKEISRACRKIRLEQSGMRFLKNKNGLNIIDATYSSNPNGIIFHLEYLKNLEGKKIIIMPCLIELGGGSKKVHKKIGKKINEICDLAIITTKDRFKEIKQVAPKSFFMSNANEINKKIKSFSNSGDTVLLESRVPKKLIDLLNNEN